MSMTSSWAALYFIALMTFGNYVLFNLLVAILVEGFSTEVRPHGSHALIVCKRKRSKIFSLFFLFIYFVLCFECGHAWHNQGSLSTSVNDELTAE
jgi:hypothetical protein